MSGEQNRSNPIRRTAADENVVTDGSSCNCDSIRLSRRWKLVAWAPIASSRPGVMSNDYALSIWLLSETDWIFSINT